MKSLQYILQGNEEGCIDLDKQDGNDTLNDARVQELLKTGSSWSTMWLKFGQQVYPYDNNLKQYQIML